MVSFSRLNKEWFLKIEPKSTYKKRVALSFQTKETKIIGPNAMTPNGKEEAKHRTKVKEKNKREERNTGI